MITGKRIDEYVARITEVKNELENRGWFKIRHDEWSSPSGDTIRFGYSHTEFRMNCKWAVRPGRPSVRQETHVIRVRPQGEAHVPTVTEILDDIVEIKLAAWRPERAAQNGVVSQPQA